MQCKTAAMQKTTAVQTKTSLQQKTTALHIGAGNSNVSFEKIKLLVESGADVNAKDASGKKPLDLAKLRDDEEGPIVFAFLEEKTTEE